MITGVTGVDYLSRMRTFLVRFDNGNAYMLSLSDLPQGDESAVTRTTVSELAMRAGMKRPNVSRLEHGRHEPSLDTLERIAEALETPVAQLVAREVKPRCA